MLETLKDVEFLGDEPVEHVGLPPTDPLRATHPISYITVDHLNNRICFKIQDGPIKEFGKNGCQIDHIFHACYKMMRELNDKHPCPENLAIIEKLGDIGDLLQCRRHDREKRGVEGTNAL